MIIVLVLLALFARRMTGMQEIRGNSIRRRSSFRNWVSKTGAAALSFLIPGRKQKSGEG
jgi:hypothetical protein